MYILNIYVDGDDVATVVVVVVAAAADDDDGGDDNDSVHLYEYHMNSIRM